MLWRCAGGSCHNVAKIVTGSNKGGGPGLRDPIPVETVIVLSTVFKHEGQDRAREAKALFKVFIVFVIYPWWSSSNKTNIQPWLGLAKRWDHGGVEDSSSVPLNWRWANCLGSQVRPGQGSPLALNKQTNKSTNLLTIGNWGKPSINVQWCKGKIFPGLFWWSHSFSFLDDLTLGWGVRQVNRSQVPIITEQAGGWVTMLPGKMALIACGATVLAFTGICRLWLEKQLRIFSENAKKVCSKCRLFTY